MVRQKWVRTAAVAVGGFVVWAMTGQAQAIVGGAAVAGGGAPVAAVVRVEADHGFLDGGLSCTGTLIAAQWVVTAQHCTNVGKEPGHPYRPGEMTVRVGGQRRAVGSVWRMDGYEAKKLVNDVALLRLGEPVTTVPPVRIADGPVVTGRDGYAYGFGSTGDGWAHVAEVRATTLQAVNRGPCLFPGRGELAFVTSVHGGSSPGDSGGPTLTWEGSAPVLHTVTAGSADRQTCGPASLTQRPGDWVGIYNRIDRGSVAWPFLRAHVPGL